MKEHIALRAGGFLLLMSLLCGLLYTLAVTGIAQLLFPYQANGSIIEIDGKKYGCALLAQPFADNGHLWGRVMEPDGATYTDENGAPLLYAAPSNLSPASEEYARLIAQRVERMQAANPDAEPSAVPVELVTGSGSGLDPDLSPAAANYQVPRIAAATGRSREEVQAIIDRYTTGRFLGIFGEPRVNVLKVNLALEGLL